MRVLVNNNFIKATCKKCNSELGVLMKDIRYNEIAHHCSTFEVTCEACGAIVGLEPTSIPVSWRQAIATD
jgi:RNase P subunit RPR2